MSVVAAVVFVAVAVVVVVAALVVVVVVVIVGGVVVVVVVVVVVIVAGVVVVGGGGGDGALYACIDDFLEASAAAIADQGANSVTLEALRQQSAEGASRQRPGTSARGRLGKLLTLHPRGFASA